MTQQLTAAQLKTFVETVDQFEQYRSMTLYEKEELVKDILSRPYMDLMCDWAFKYIMSDMENAKMLISDILGIELNTVAPLPGELMRNRPNDKNIIMDVLCTDDVGNSFIVEMQRKQKKDFKNRMFYYGASSVHFQLSPGDPYSNLKPVYVICFMNFTFPHDDDKLIYRYELRENGSGELYGDQLRIVFCELPRLKKHAMKEMDSVESWFYLFRNIRNFVAVPEGMNKRYERIVSAAKMPLLSDEDMKYYLRAMISESEKLELIEDGRALGLEEGFTRGMAKGRQESQLDIARNMLSDGLDIAKVAQYSGLSVEEVQALAAK